MTARQLVSLASSMVYKMLRPYVAIIAVLIAPGISQGGEMWTVRGRVLAADGRPAAGNDVSYAWSATGKGKDGKPLARDKEENLKEIWGHVGEMQPHEGVQSDADGAFSITMARIFYAIMAMNADRTQGGMVLVPKENTDALIEVRLGPLVRVRGAFEGPPPGVPLGWTHLYVNFLEDPTRPLDMTRIVSCGSYESKFAMSLPPGRYLLEGNNDKLDLNLIPEKQIVLTAATAEVDLGVIRLSDKPIVPIKRERSKAAGTWGDYTKHYGRRPPSWHVTDARGASKDVRLDDFKGKWLLLDFWGLSCSVCLKNDIPRLMKFYEDHRAQRDRFEILSICIDDDGDVQTMAELDRRLKPIVEHVWGGKTIKFPILLDSTFETWENFGLPGLGTMLLIDPQGNLVEGDDATLAEKLKP